MALDVRAQSLADHLAIDGHYASCFSQVHLAPICYSGPNMTPALEMLVAIAVSNRAWPCKSSKVLLSIT